MIIFTGIQIEINDDEGHGSIDCMNKLYYVKPSRRWEDMQAVFILVLHEKTALV